MSKTEETASPAHVRGAVVMLRSGSPSMTVDRVTDDLAFCVMWHGGTYFSQTFAHASLVPASDQGEA